MQEQLNRDAWGSVTVADDWFINRSQVAGIERCEIDLQVCWTSMMHVGIVNYCGYPNVATGISSGH